jgi:hypothetical protein
VTAHPLRAAQRGSDRQPSKALTDGTSTSRSHTMAGVKTSVVRDQSSSAFVMPSLRAFVIP